MNFLISEKILFNPEDGSLTHCETNDTVQLTLTASRIFTALLMAKNGLLEREQLLKEVWDDYGLQSSNSSLNQYISILRRALSRFGCAELIITVPKMGFRLNPEVNICPQEIFTLPVSDISAPQHASKKTRLSGQRLNSITLLLALICGVSLMLFYFILPAQANHYALYGDRLNAGCNLVFMKDFNKNARKVAKTHISAILQDNQAACGPEKKIIFDSNDSFTSQSAGRTLLALCTVGENEQIISCDNFYYNNWGEP